MSEYRKPYARVSLEGLEPGDYLAEFRRNIGENGVQLFQIREPRGRLRTFSVKPYEPHKLEPGEKKIIRQTAD